MGRIDTAWRVIPAPTERVFSALIDRRALTRWLPPEGMSGRFERFEARPGGGYRLVLTRDDGSPGTSGDGGDVVEARYTQIVAGFRVRQEVGFVTDDPAFQGTMTVTWEITSADGGTRVDVSAEDVPPGIGADDHAAGLASSLEGLAAYLAG